MKSHHLLFGYGSLMDPESASKTVRRPVTLGKNARPATLANFERNWDYWQNLVDEQGGHVPLRFLGVTERIGYSCNGVAIRVSDAELARFDMRERYYRRSEVVVEVDGAPRPAFVYMIDPGMPTPPADARISSRYEKLVERAAEALGPGFAEVYRQTTITPMCARYEGSYSFVDRSQAQAAGRR